MNAEKGAIIYRVGKKVNIKNRIPSNLYECRSKSTKPHPKRRAIAKRFLSWQHTTTSYKTRKTNLDSF